MVVADLRVFLDAGGGWGLSAWSTVKVGRSALALGVVVGIGLAVSGIIEDPSPESAVPADAIAVVGGRSIPRASYERALAALAADHRGPVGPREREAVLERLIDEELLVQEAIARGVGERDPRVRTDLGLAMLAVLRAAEEDRGPPSETELLDFYETHADRFRGADRYVARQVFFEVRGDDEAARARATAARAALAAGRSVAGDPSPLPMPTGPRTPPELERTFGPSFAHAVVSTPPGTWSDPVRSSLGYHVVRVDERLEGEPRPFDEARPLVESAVRRARSEAALAAFLAEQRERVEIRRGSPGG